MNTSMDPLSVILLAILQGITELFPVSSLGNSVVIPHLLHWNIDPRANTFLPLLVALHLGTAVALLIYFRQTWLDLIRSLPAFSPRNPQSRLILLLIVGTIPAGLIGLIFEKRIAALFGNIQFVAIFLILNGLLLFSGEWLRRRAQSGDVLTLNYPQAFGIGISQALALLPGFSRSGASLVGGLLTGLSHEAAARFGFLLATPIILAAGVLEIPKLLQPDARGDLVISVVGGLVAGVVAYLSTAFLMRYFKRYEVNALVPFGLYCILLGLAGLLIG